MANKLFFITLCLLGVLKSGAQTVSLIPQVVSSGGAYYEYPAFSISQTVGEMTAITTLVGGSAMLTQGFQQSDVSPVLGISDKERFDAALELFPNPAIEKAQLSFEFSMPGELDMVVYNSLGQPVSSRFSERYSSGKQTFTFHTELLAAGIYYVTTVFTSSKGSQYSYSNKLRVIK